MSFDTGRSHAFCHDYRVMFNNIINQMGEYLDKYKHLRSFVIGLSGGIDSALVAAIARYVADFNEEIVLIGVNIPIDTVDKDEEKRADLVGHAFCHSYSKIDMTNMYYSWSGYDYWNDTLTSKNIEDKVRQGNLKARMRMCVLYDVAQAENGIVLSTDNFTEYLLGYWTLHGDVGDYGPIQNLWKTEVYGMAKYLMDLDCREDRNTALDRCIGAVPTDGLGITNNDLEALGANSYDDVDRILFGYLCGVPFPYAKDVSPQAAMSITRRYIRTEYKRHNPYNISRDDVVKGAKGIWLLK